MGINIKYGYKIQVDSLLVLQEFATTLREEIQEPMRDLIHTRMSRTCEQILDLYHLYPGNKFYNELTNSGIENPYEKPYISAYHEFIRGLLLSRTGESNPNYNFDANLLVTFRPQGYCLGMLYTDQPSFAEVVQGMNQVEEYSYVDSDTDDFKPEGVSEEDWKIRAEDWGDAFGSSPASMRSFSINLTIPDRFKPDPGSIVSRIRDKEVRSKLIARTIMLTDFYKSCKKTMTDQEKLGCFIKKINTDSGKKQLEERTQQLYSILPESYGINSIMKDLEKKTKIKKSINK